MDIFVTAAAGTEGALRDELRELRLRVRADRGGVHVDGGLEAAALICLSSRIAVRVMMAAGEIDAGDERALYDGARAIEWERWLDPSRTLGVSAVARDSALTHTGFIAQRTKDAIVDRQRDGDGKRSDVARQDPDVGIFVHLKKDRARIYLDASGRSLHQRGWRAQGGGAPLKETLAAAMVRLSGWDREQPFVDPMCGSGTIAIEADLWARGVPPHPRAQKFGFERWADFDATRAGKLDELRESIFDQARDEGPECFAADIDERATELARVNAERAGARVRVRCAPVSELRVFRPKVQLVTNPPYGVRIAQERVWEDLTELFDRWRSQSAAVLVPADLDVHLAPRRPDARHPLKNGDLSCAFLVWKAL